MSASTDAISRCDAPDLGALTYSLGFVLRMAQVVAYDKFFECFPDGTVRPGEFTVLWVIARNPGVRQGDVARVLNIKRPHMTKLIKRVVKSGLVERYATETDRRSVLLKLSDNGQAMVARWADTFLNVYSAADSPLTPREYDTMIGLLRKYAQLDGDTR